MPRSEIREFGLWPSMKTASHSVISRTARSTRGLHDLQTADLSIHGDINSKCDGKSRLDNRSKCVSLNRMQFAN